MSTQLSKIEVPEVSGLTADQRGLLSEIMRDVQASVNRLEAAARKWMELPPGARKKIVEQTNASYRDFWSRLEKVGAGVLHPQLATVGGRAAQLLGKLPMEEQDRYLRDLIPVVVKGKGPRAGWDVRNIDVADLSEEQRKQVFRVKNDGQVIVRDREMQEAYLADKMAREIVERTTVEHVNVVDRAGWVARDGRVFPKPDLVKGGITKKQLQKMIADLEG